MYLDGRSNIGLLFIIYTYVYKPLALIKFTLNVRAYLIFQKQMLLSSIHGLYIDVRRRTSAWHLDIIKRYNGKLYSR